MSRVSAPLSARAKPQAWRSMCGCARRGRDACRNMRSNRHRSRASLRLPFAASISRSNVAASEVLAVAAVIRRLVFRRSPVA